MRIIIGHIALIEKDKRQHITIQAVEKLCSMGHDAYGLIIGSHSMQSEEYHKQIKDEVDSLGLTNRVIFLGRRNDVPDILTQIDVVIIPSVEGFPLTGLEACAAGVPIVACDVGGAKEFIEVSGSGVCFKFDDPDDASVSIVNCLNQRNEYADNGKRFAKGCSTMNYKESLSNIFMDAK